MGNFKTKGYGKVVKAYIRSKGVRGKGFVLYQPIMNSYDYSVINNRTKTTSEYAKKIISNSKRLRKDVETYFYMIGTLEFS